MTTVQKIANVIVSLYVGIETSTMKIAYKLGKKIHEAMTKDKATWIEIEKMVLSLNRNVRRSTLAEYARFYRNLGMIDIELRKSYINAHPEDKDGNNYKSIVVFAMESNILYTKMSLLSTVAPETVKDIFENPETVKAVNDLTVPEVEAFRTLLNKHHKSIADALEIAKKDNYGKFLENLSTELTKNGIDGTDGEESTAGTPVDHEIALKAILKEYFQLNLDDYSTMEELFHAVEVVVKDEKPEEKPVEKKRTKKEKVAA